MISLRENQAEIMTESLSKLASFPEDTDDIYRNILSMNVKRIPYVSITQYIYKVYTKNSSADDMLAIDNVYEFPDFYLYKLKEYIEKSCMQNCRDIQSEELCCDCEGRYVVGLKVYEHLVLASSQVEELFIAHENQIREIEGQLKKFTQEARMLSEELERSERKLRKLNKRSKEMISNYISILGIFAAILLGAFGAMQGFTSLFENASQMKVSKLLVISGVGGVTVVTILHMLLDGVAKLSGNSIVSDSKKEANLYQRYPFLLISLYSLWTVIVAGVSLKYAQEYPDEFKVKFISLLAFFLIGSVLPLLPILFIKFLIGKIKKRKKTE